MKQNGFQDLVQFSHQDAAPLRREEVALRGIHNGGFAQRNKKSATICLPLRTILTRVPWSRRGFDGPVAEADAQASPCTSSSPPPSLNMSFTRQSSHICIRLAASGF